MNRRRRLEE
ncbi:unnamed protein product, partial [Didymodactylos carnosus]